MECLSELGYIQEHVKALKYLKLNEPIREIS